MTNISALLGSRICHDLINPLGAIGNGIELLELSGTTNGEELRLVQESVENATAKVKLMRLAFGDAAVDQVVPRRDILSTLDAIARGGRLSYSWNVPGDPNRQEVRTALLAVMCIETALPLGGDIEITSDQMSWTIYTRNERLNLDPELWVPLSRGDIPQGLAAAHVQFALLNQMALEAGRSLTLSHGSDWVKIGF
ncbi:MAG: histidine phosphotransferase family protein [Pseudomonadota bacterium]